MSDTADDPRSTFLKTLPRKIVEIKATLGALIADPRSNRMRDELRRRLQGLYSLARSYQLTALAEALKLGVDQVDATRALPALGRAHLDRLASLIGSLSARAEQDTRDPVSSPAMSVPSGTRLDAPHTRTLIPGTTPGIAKTPPPEAPSRRGHRNPAFSTLSRALPPMSLPMTGAALQVLFVGSREAAQKLTRAWPADFEITVVPAHDDALLRARDTAPDVVVAELKPPADGAALLHALRDDALTDFLPVIILAGPGDVLDAVRERCPGAREVFGDDVSPQGLQRAIERATRGTTTMPPAPTQDLGELTVEELTRALQDEIRRGIVGAVPPGTRATRIPIGPGNEVLAATWEAIARIREVVEQHSRGAIRFEVPTSPRGLPGTEVFTFGADTPPVDGELPGEDPLPARVALVVDDDAAVVAQFSRLLGDAGMTVHGATDGDEALHIARRVQPDVILTDILMPGLDGFALCRAIRRDVLLRHTPVIFISWKEDLLTRMRELGAQASGYLRKEARADAILARVRAAVRLRVRTLKRVRDLPFGAEVRGRLERVGSIPLLEVAAEGLEDATVTFADSSSVTEMELRGGRMVSATRTVQDGSLVRGEAALMHALGAATARFGVRRATHAVRENLDGPLRALLRRCARRISALEECVSGAVLLDVHRLHLDREAAMAYARSLPAPMRTTVERMVEGDSPLDLVLRDGLAPQDFEPLLVELARRGAIQQVIGRSGEDLIAKRLSAMEEAERAQASLPPRLPITTGRPAAPPPPATVPVTPVDEGEESLGDAVFRELRDELDEEDEEAAASHPVTERAPPQFTDVPPAPIAPRSPLPRVSPSEPPRVSPVPAAPRSPLPPATQPLRPEAPERLELLRPADPLRDDEFKDFVREGGVDAPSVPAPSAPSEAPPAALVSGAPAAREHGARDSAPPPSGIKPADDFPTMPFNSEALAKDLDQAFAQVVQSAEEASKPTVPPPAPIEPIERPHEPASRTSKGAAANDKTEPPPPPSEAMRRRPSTKPAPAAAKEADEAESESATSPAKATTSTSPAKATTSTDSTKATTSTSPAKATTSTGGDAAAKPAVPADEQPTRKLATVSADLDPSGRRPSRPRPLRAPPESSWQWPLLLLLLVSVAVALAYAAVRWWVTRPPEVSPEVEAPEQVDAAPAVPSAAPSAAPAPTPSEGVGDASAAPTDAPAEAPPVAPNGRYRDAAPYLDGGALPEGHGLLVVNAPRRGASAVEVSVDQRPAGNAPVVLTLPSGFHAVRFRAGIITSYQFATVRAGVAVMVDAPADR